MTNAEFVIWHLFITLSRFPSRGRLKAMLHGMIIARDNLPAHAFGQVNHERGFKVQRERSRRVADDGEHLRVVGVIETDLSDLALGNAHLIVGHKTARAHDAERDLRPIDALQPGQGRVLRVAEQHPALTVFHPDQPIDKREDVCLFDLEVAELGGGDVHIVRQSRERCLLAAAKS